MAFNYFTFCSPKAAQRVQQQKFYVLRFNCVWVCVGVCGICGYFMTPMTANLQSFPFLDSLQEKNLKEYIFEAYEKGKQKSTWWG